jgi:hypothetical protein
MMLLPGRAEVSVGGLGALGMQCRSFICAIAAGMSHARPDDRPSSFFQQTTRVRFYFSPITNYQSPITVSGAAGARCSICHFHRASRPALLI